jgi:transcriptional regulator with XRE-family HTH domain
MTKLESYRRSLGLTLEDVARELGRSSKGHISPLENGARASIRLALQIERWSRGEVPAIDLVADEDRQLLRDALDRAGRPAAPTLEGAAA